MVRMEQFKGNWVRILDRKNAVYCRMATFPARCISSTALFWSAGKERNYTSPPTDLSMKGMWFVLEWVVLAAIVLLSITEFFWPLISGKPLFGSFRKKSTALAPGSLDQEIEDARRKAEEVKRVQRKAEEDLRKAWNRKDEADDLLK